jgi:hypothetical protein
MFNDVGIVTFIDGCRTPGCAAPDQRQERGIPPRPEIIPDAASDRIDAVLSIRFLLKRQHNLDAIVSAPILKTMEVCGL